MKDSNISETCPSCGCDAFDSLHSEPGELQRRQCKRCGEVAVKPVNWVDESLAIAGEKKEETMAKETKDLNCQECGNPFKNNLALAIHRRKKHGVAGPHAKDRPRRKPASIPVGSLGAATVREELLDTLSKRKNQLLAQVAEVDDVIDALEKAGR